MSEDWIPLDRRPITVPPTQQDVELARDVCFKMLDKMFGLFWHSGIISDTRDAGEAEPQKRQNLVRMMPFWATTSTDAFTEIQTLNDEADQRVRRWAFFFDRFSAGVLNMGRSSYSNAALAIVGMVGEFIGRASDARAALAEIDPSPPVSDEIAMTLARLARKVWDAGIAVVGADFNAAYSRIQASLRVEIGKAWDGAQEFAPTPPAAAGESTFSYEEQQIIDTLREEGRRLPAIKLLPKAKLKENSNMRTLLGQMRQRGVIDNDHDKRGRGYGLPEWNDEER